MTTTTNPRRTEHPSNRLSHGEVRDFTEAVSARFWSRVIRTEHTDWCWLWTGATQNKGYGVFWQNGRLVLAHRASYEFVYEPIPDGMCVLHRCDNPACVNPEHLFLGSHADNMADCVTKGRHANGSHLLRGESSPNAKLTDAAVTAIRARYRDGGISQRRLGAEYGVDQKTIRRALTGATWSHLGRDEGQA